MHVEHASGALGQNLKSEHTCGKLPNYTKKKKKKWSPLFELWSIGLNNETVIFSKNINE